MELIVTVLIISILAGTLTAGLSSMREKANRVACTSNLRVLHQAFADYTLDKGYWPQEPDGLGSEGHEFFGWIIGEVTPYGGGRNVWICPSDKRLNLINVTTKNFEGSYVPTLFSATEGRPWQWKQPWIMERGNAHGSGALMIMPDGAVLTSNEVKYTY